MKSSKLSTQNMLTLIMSFFYDSPVKRVEAYGFSVKTGEGWVE
ncbi:hypothetical protein [Bartonella apis]